MRGPVPYRIEPFYQHMTEKETEIWSRFIQKYPDYFDEVWYDWEIGSWRGNEDLKPEWARNRAYLGKYKIDAVGRKGDTYTIVEIKKAATTKALGEIWAYEFMWKQENPEAKKVECVIVTDEEMPNIRQICEAEDVKLFIV
jgi:hypothetical protein